MSKESKQLFAFGDFRLDPGAGLLFHSDIHVPLPPKVLKTLVILVEHAGELLTKDELIKAVWPDTFVEEGNLTVNIHALRKVLGDSLIETVPRRGYRFTAAVTQIDPAPPVMADRKWGMAWPVMLGLCVLAAASISLARRARALTEADLVRLTSNIAEDSQPDVAPDGKSIVFVSNRDGGKGEIYVMDADGRNPRNLTNHPANDDSPAWSPDGKRIAFQSNRRGPIELFVMDADGGNPTPLGPGARPAWSPDGRQLAFNRIVNRRPEIFVMTAAGGSGGGLRLDGAGGEARRLTFDQDFCADASWSPDGRRIAFTTTVNHMLQVAVMGVDGSDRVTLTSGGHNRLPAWSPDGGRIVFNSDRGGKDALYIMATDGSLQRRISPGDVDDEEAAWTRDGRSLVFQSERDGNTEIYRMRLANDPDGAIRLTHTVAAENSPAWSPDGKWIAFASNREGKSNIFLMDPQGGQVHRLAQNPSADLSPAWSRDGKKLAFASDRGGSMAIYEMDAAGGSGGGLRLDAAGGAARRITDGGTDDHPHWSADGQQICFSRGHGIWVTSVAGSAAQRLDTGETCAWSPDGRDILFDRDQDAVREIYRISASGGAAVAITRNGRGNGGPAWSVDGSWIAFNSNSDGFGFGIFLMKPDGAGQARITGRRTFDEDPAWSPDGRWIAFTSGRDGNREIYKIAVP